LLLLLLLLLNLLWRKETSQNRQKNQESMDSRVFGKAPKLVA